MSVTTGGYRRQINTAVVLQTIKNRGPITRALLARTLGCTLPTISTIVSDLISANLVLESGKGESSGGRKPALLEFNWATGYVVGIDVDEEYVIAAVADLSGFIISTRMVEIPDDFSGRWLVVTLYNIIDLVLSDGGVDRDQLRGIAVGVPGTVRQPDGTVVACPTLELYEFHLAEALRNEFHVDVQVDNGVNLAALAEKQWGAGENTDNMVFINIRRGIKAGIIIEGELFRGPNGSAGEIGFMAIDRGSLNADYTKFGYFETVCGHAAVKQRVIEGLRGGMKSALPSQPSEIRLASVFQAAANGDPLGIKILDNICDLLAMAIANIIAVIAPELIVLSAEVSLAGEQIFTGIESRLGRLLPYVPRIVPSAIPEGAMLMGAVALAIRDAEVTQNLNLPLKLVK